MKKFYVSFCLLLTVGLTSVVFNSCGDDKKDNSPLEKQREACEVKSHPDSLYTWKNNKCEAEYIGQEDPCKSIKNTIAALVADSIKQAQAVRDAIEPATAEPKGARDNYDATLINAGPANNIADTARISMIWGSDMERFGINDKEKDALSDVSELFLNTCNQIATARQELANCK